MIWEKFLPTVIGGDVSQVERVLFSLTARWGGFGVFNPTETETFYSISRQVTDVIGQAIKSHKTFEVDTHLNLM